MANYGQGYGPGHSHYSHHNQDRGDRERGSYGGQSNQRNDSSRDRSYNQPIPSSSTSYPDQYPFFLPGEGIARQVIQTDLPRYLGNNAHCKPGVSQNGREGFWYKGYRMLTDAQIQSLKEDSAKWNNERQQFSSRHGGRDGPDYDQSYTFGSSHRNNPEGYNPDGTSFNPKIQPPPPPPPETIVEQPNIQDQRYLFMPHPDNRPWYDNWTGRYVHPFREPGATSPEPIPPANVPPPMAQIPRHIDLPESPIPPPEEGGIPHPLDPITGLPMTGHWTRERDGTWAFRATLSTTRTARTGNIYGRNEQDEREQE